jgi:hypothetical protein
MEEFVSGQKYWIGLQIPRIGLTSLCCKESQCKFSTVQETKVLLFSPSFFALNN